jgi:hypothetical protein
MQVALIVKKGVAGSSERLGLFSVHVLAALHLLKWLKMSDS